MRKRDVTAFIISIISLVIVLILISPYLLNLDPTRSLIESKISGMSGYDVRIAGGLDLAVFPEQRLFAGDVTVRSGGSTIASIEKAALYMDLLPFVKESGGTAGIDHIVLFNPVINIQRNEEGGSDIEPLERNKGVKARIKARRFTLVNGNVNLSGLGGGGDMKLSGLNMDMSDLELIPAEPGEASFTGKVRINKLHTPLLVLSDISMNIRARKGRYHMDPVRAALLGGSGEGTIKINVNGESPRVAVKSDLAALKLKKLFGVFDKEGNLSGNVDLSLDINMLAGGMDEAVKTVNGSFDLNGGPLAVKGMDIDEFLNKYRRTQNVGVMEISAFLIAGPVGTVISSGVEYGDLYGAGTGKDGEIREFISSWEIKNGVMSSRDVAFATEKNRMALTGGLDFVNGTFEDVLVSVLDTDGCSEFTQRITGPLKEPEVEKRFLKRTLFGPAISLIKKAGKLLSGGKCEPFYVGAVRHPQ